VRPFRVAVASIGPSSCRADSASTLSVPSTFTRRWRKLPSGRPDEESVVLVEPDPTWALEYKHFLSLCETGGTNLHNDLWINDALGSLARTAVGTPA